MQKFTIGTYSQSKKSLIRPARTMAPTSRPVRIHRRRRRWPYYLLLLVIIIPFAYFYLYPAVAKLLDETVTVVQQACTDILNPDCWPQTSRPKLKQTDAGMSNLLIVGLDTRENDSGLLNTDTLMLVSFDTTTERAMMISIPRDTYIPAYNSKINGIYALTRHDNPGDEFRELKEVVTSITGQPIHYLVQVKLQGITAAIDEIGGITVCPPKAVTAEYPNENATALDPQWLYFDFVAGCQQADGQRALVYARFRHVSSGDRAQASDFARGKRQQEVLEAVKDKMLGTDMKLKDRISMYLGLIASYSDTIKIENYSPEDVLAALGYIDTADRDPVNIVLDPYFGGLNKLIYEANYNVLPKGGSYLAVQAELASIWEHYDFYRESPSVLVRNMSELTGLPPEHKAVSLRDYMKYYQNFTISNHPKDAKLPPILLWDYTGENKGSMELIKAYLGENVTVADPVPYGYARTNANEEIVIFIGMTPAPTLAPTSAP